MAGDREEEGVASPPGRPLSLALLAQAVTKMQAAAAKLPQTQVTDGQAR